MATAVMAREPHATERDNDRDTLFMLSGIALMVFGAGLILSNPVAQKYLGRLGVPNLAKDALPDLERYLRLRAM
ncbi:MAG: hypothetical protein WAL85_08415 [Candidatus Korobacteraceae bacterium]